MFDAIWKTLSENYPKLAGYGALIIVISWVSIKCHSFYVKTKQVCDDHLGIKNKLDLLLDKFNSLIAALGESNAIKNPDFFSTSSPLNLTEKGLDFVRTLGWNKIVDNNEQRKILFDNLRKLKLKTKADVEKYCIVILTELYGNRDENPFTKIKEYLYENAKIDRQNAITACAIYLRDKYLESYPEIK